METVHVPVLLNEVIEGLRVEKIDLWLLDGTLGGAGHSLALAKAYGGKLSLIGLDRDETAITRAKAKFEAISDVASKPEKWILECEDYRALDRVCDKHSVLSLDLILLDLGISSDELEASGKGFTFQKDEPLLMTFGDPNKQPFTAKKIVNEWDEEVLANIIFGYGEDRFARRIAKAIVGYRQRKPIETTVELSEIVRGAVPAFSRKGKIHPATRTFQALRIAVNDELGALREGLKKGFERLSKGGRIAVISFHSLEDRIVKEFFVEKTKVGQGKALTKRPIVASDQEIAENPRSRSAKLRVFQKA